MPEPHTPESILAEFSRSGSKSITGEPTLNVPLLARHAAMWRNEAADSEEIAVRLQQENEEVKAAHALMCDLYAKQGDEFKSLRTDRDRLAAIVQRMKNLPRYSCDATGTYRDERGYFLMLKDLTRALGDSE